jgi:hypothetical protein
MSTFEKNVFLPNECVRGHVKVDNTHCQIDCNRVHFAVEQRLRMTIQPHSWNFKKDLVEETVHGPRAGEGNWDKAMECDLSKIHYEV